MNCARTCENTLKNFHWKANVFFKLPEKMVKDLLFFLRSRLKDISHFLLFSSEHLELNGI